MKTKKAGSTARFGARYGKRIRDTVRKFETQKRFRCPRCGKLGVKREGYGIWRCTKCGARFAGGAYFPQTEAGKVAARLVKEPEKAKEVVEETEGEEG